MITSVQQDVHWVKCTQPSLDWSTIIFSRFSFLSSSLAPKFVSPSFKLYPTLRFKVGKADGAIALSLLPNIFISMSRRWNSFGQTYRGEVDSECFIQESQWS